MIPRILIAFILAFVSFATSALAEPATQFFCFTEQAANELAKTVVSGEGTQEEIAAPYLKSGKCVLLPFPVNVQITYKGKLFEGAALKVRVVGFPAVEHGGDDKKTLFYALWPEADLAAPTRESGPGI